MASANSFFRRCPRSPSKKENRWSGPSNAYAMSSTPMGAWLPASADEPCTSMSRSPDLTEVKRVASLPSWLFGNVSIFTPRSWPLTLSATAWIPQRVCGCSVV